MGLSTSDKIWHTITIKLDRISSSSYFDVWLTVWFDLKAKALAHTLFQLSHKKTFSQVISKQTEWDELSTPVNDFDARESPPTRARLILLSTIKVSKVALVTQFKLDLQR